MYPSPYNQGYRSPYGNVGTTPLAVAPTVRNVRSGTTSSNPLLPAHQAGDVLLVAGIWDIGRNATAAGWTIVDTVTDGKDLEMRVFKKEAVSGSDTNLNPNFNPALWAAVAVDGNAVDSFASIATPLSVEIVCERVNVVTQPAVLLHFAYSSSYSVVPNLTAPNTSLVDITRAAFFVSLVVGSQAVTVTGLTPIAVAPVTPASTGAAISVAIN